MANPIVSSLTFSDLIGPGSRMFKPPRNMCPAKPLSFREKMSVRALSRLYGCCVDWNALLFIPSRGCPQTTNLWIHRKGASSFCLEKHLRF